MNKVCSGNNYIIHKNGLEYLQFSNLKKYESIITHCFTTRIGGVSSNEYNTLNMGFNNTDDKSNVEENYKRISKYLNIDYKNMVFSNQVHDIKLKIVDENDKGKGIIKKSDIIGYDGLLTNKKEVVLVTFYADCVPLFFFDPRQKVIALSHSGWKGTVKGIARETILKMESVFGCKADDIEVAIGPSIGKCCFEVGEEVYKEFIKEYNWSKDFCIEAGQGKWNISLQDIIKTTLLNCGVKQEHISLSGICTKCNNDKFFSYRGDNGKTGRLAAIMQLNPS